MRLGKRSNRSRPKLLVVHQNLCIGGAERQLVELLKKYNQTRLEIVLVLYEARGAFVNDLRSIASHKTIVLPVSKSIFGLGRILGLLNVFVKERPDGVCSYLVNVNVATYIAARILRVRTVVWGLRVSKFSKKTFGTKGAITNWIAKHLSRDVDLMIANNEKGLAYYYESGYCPRKAIVIHNGIDTDRFCPSKILRDSFRCEIGAQEKDQVICKVARIVDWKGYEYFIEAISIISRTHRDIIFVCVGSGDGSLLQKYKRELHRTSPETRVIWLGDRLDMENVFNGSDIVTLVSTEGEGFSNVLGEAMAVSKPIVVSDVGDSSRIVGDAALIVKPKDSTAIVVAWNTLLSDRQLASDMGNRGRNRVVSHYSARKSILAMERAVLSCIST